MDLADIYRDVSSQLQRRTLFSPEFYMDEAIRITEDTGLKSPFKVRHLASTTQDYQTMIMNLINVESTNISPERKLRALIDVVACYKRERYAQDKLTILADVAATFMLPKPTIRKTWRRGKQPTYLSEDDVRRIKYMHKCGVSVLQLRKTFRVGAIRIKALVS